MKTATSHIVGTSNFVSIDAARRYYRPYGYSVADVRNMLAEGTISIGPPEVTAPDTLTVIKDEGRYAIVVKKVS
jgi:hypothetical protein